MQIGDLRYFVAVAEAESFAEAGRRLGPNNSTLSRRLMHLEDELNRVRKGAIRDSVDVCGQSCPSVLLTHLIHGILAARLELGRAFLDQGGCLWAYALRCTTLFFKVFEKTFDYFALCARAFSVIDSADCEACFVRPDRYAPLRCRVWRLRLSPPRIPSSPSRRLPRIFGVTL
jgi:hypothetical protein